MAKHTVTRLVDDLDGGDADETVPFEVDGKAYEIDLSEVNAEKLRAELRPYVTAARRRKRGPSAPSRPATRGSSMPIRQWLREHGHKVADRGRIPSDLLELYKREAH